ncbi:TolC family protein [Caballeronia sp. LZ035]|uniref:TolC family protein n=1 Tax=Caballeronia sp. LZ035 TaxID=3038568 RepID=UPI00285F733B|nr:TolC family protein [Caballeronia sp. LZ035]MDR5763251.1 TolC family protein [Caballeronia sp. LZ035]
MIAGCAVGPDYVKPEARFAPFHNSIDAPSQNATRPTAPIDDWWRGFNDPKLTAVVERALQQNLDLKASYARIQQARAVASSAGAQLLPTLDLNGSATAEHQSLVGPLGSIASAFPGYHRNQREYALGSGASWEIDIAGGLRRSAAAARDEETAAEANHVGTRISVAADAADAYLHIRGLQAQITVTGDQIDTDAKLLALVQARKHAGAADDREVAQAEALLRQAKTTLPTLRMDLEAQLNRLDVLMGAQPGTYADELSQAATIPPVPSIDDRQEPLEVLRRRPDIIAAERHLAASNERIGAAISDYYPKVSLSGVLGFDSTSPNSLFTSRSFQPFGSGAIRWRLFDFGKVKAEVEQARGANREALVNYQLAALKATEDVENAFVLLSQTEARLLELDGEVDALTRARDLSERAYQAGAITLTDVLDADRQLLSARSDLDGTRADAARAAVTVFRSLGGGWSISDDAKLVAVQPGAIEVGK